MGNHSNKIEKSDLKSAMKKALVLHSGGLDSSVCLLLARQLGWKVISLGIDYGQRSHIEMKYAERFCKKHKIQRRIIRVQWDKPKRIIPKNRNVEEIRHSESPAFLPGRNAVFLALAAAESAGIGAEEIWIGVNSVDYSGYPDCRPEFIDAFQAMLNVAFPNGPKVIAPLQELSKPEIAGLAIHLGLSREETWSCYRPNQSGQTFQPCGKCDGCILDEYAWTNAKAMNLVRFKGLRC
jgi:7-cyano-7-deazaguanine synthase